LNRKIGEDEKRRTEENFEDLNVKILNKFVMFCFYFKNIVNLFYSRGIHGL
jgi:hypothetical protein